MHKVVRNAPPLNLNHKHEEWMMLLEENKDIKNDWDQWDKNKKEEVRAALREMYRGCCCYCEGRVESVSYLHIEHFKPKSKYKELCYDYANLHYCCEKCNITKGEKYNDKMFSPTTSIPEDYIQYVGEVAVGKDPDGRGDYMIRILKLNERKALKDERAKRLRDYEKSQSDINDSIKEIVESNYNEYAIRVFLIHLRRFISTLEVHMQHGESYCSMVRCNFIDYVQELRKLVFFIVSECT